MARCHRSYLGRLCYHVGRRRNVKGCSCNAEGTHRCSATRGISSRHERAPAAQIVDFGTIMQNRQFLGEPDSVKALNLIDTVFHNVPEVRNTWANLFAALNDQRNFPPAGPAPIIDERRTALLASMARDLGLMQDFRPDDFARIYLPQSVVTEMQLRTRQRAAALNALAAADETQQQPPTQRRS